MKGVFKPNIPIFPPNSAEGLHFSAFHFIRNCVLIMVIICRFALVKTTRFDQRSVVAGMGKVHVLNVSRSNKIEWSLSRTSSRKYT